MNKNKMNRRVKVNGDVWRWRLGNRSVLCKDSNGNRVRGTFSEVTGLDQITIDSGHWNKSVYINSRSVQSFLHNKLKNQEL